MKHLIYLLSFFILFSGCTESHVKSTATDYIKNHMKDPSSFKAEKVQVLFDTIPIFLNQNILSSAKKCYEAIEDYSRYKERNSYLWQEETEKAKNVMNKAILSLKLDYGLTKTLVSSSINYIVLIKCSGKNSYGGTVSSKYIVIVDKDNTDKVLGDFNIDTDFLKKLLTIYNTIEDKKDRLKENAFGKFETDGMTPLEQFIFEEE